LAGERGLIVPFKDPAAIIEQVICLLDNEVERHTMRKRGYLYGREMVWSNVACHYKESFERAIQDRSLTPRAALHAHTLDQNLDELVALIKLDHLQRLTDGTGLLQHAAFTVPNYEEGYTTDDNARALVFTILLEELEGEMSAEVDSLASRYLAFLWHAFNPETGRFRNFLSYNRRWLEEVGSEDSHSRALWALGTTLGRSHNEGMRSATGQLFDRALPVTREFTSPRAWAFTLVAIHEHLRRFSGDRVAQSIRETLAERLLKLYERHHAPDWPWFEDIVSYSNAKLPHAMLLWGSGLTALI